MEKSHLEMAKPNWWTPPNTSQEAAREAAAAEKALKAHQASSPVKTPVPVETSEQMEVKVTPDSQAR